MAQRRSPRPGGSGLLDALVIGAGAAGLAAARELSQAGLHLCVLEARDRIGGRVLTLEPPDWPRPVELGAEFVHGEVPETLDIARAAGLAVEELPHEHDRSVRGRFISMNGFWERTQALRRRMLKFLHRRRQRDASLEEFLRRGGLTPDERSLLRDFVEGYHAAHVDQMSLRWLAGDPDEEGEASPLFIPFRPRL